MIPRGRRPAHQHDTRETSFSLARVSSDAHFKKALTFALRTMSQKFIFEAVSGSAIMKFPTKTLLCLIASQAIAASAFAKNPPSVPPPKPGEAVTIYRAWKGQRFTLPDRWDKRFYAVKGYHGSADGAAIDPTQANGTNPQSGQGPHYKKIHKPKIYPSRANGLFQVGEASCSGFLIGRSMIMTAAHCVVDEYDYDWRDLSKAWFSPGLHLGEQELRADQKLASQNIVHPYQKCGVKNAYVAKSYNSSAYAKRPRDYAFVLLDCHVGQTTGWLGLIFPPEDSAGISVMLRGYPARYQNEPYFSLGKILKIDPNGYTLFANTAGFSGFSGGSLIASSLNNKCSPSAKDRSQCAIGLLSSEFENQHIQYTKMNGPIIFHALWFKNWADYVNPPK
ncbi:MAG: trypsin-like serine peptidase [Beijerinckiaceae bacterium]